MPLTIEQIILIAAILLLVGVLASGASSKMGIPTLIAFLAIGMLAGSESFGGIHFNNPWIAQFLGVIALVIILFDGGLSTQWKEVKPIVAPGIALATFGVFMTAALLGGFASIALGYSFLDGALLGSIVSSTDAAAVFSILRSRNVSLKGNLKPLLELESGSNDPMAVFLTIGFIHLLTTENVSMWALIPMFIQNMVVGALAGYGIGKAIVWIINKINLEYEGLYPVLTSALVLLAFGLSAALGGNGFLTVYVAALVMGNSNFLHKRRLIRFHSGMAWLMQITMFIVLGLLVFPSQIVAIIPAGLLVAAFLIFVARPISVFSTLHFFNFSLKEKTLISWVGLRGAVPIILATFPLLAGVPVAESFFNIVFFVVLTSVLIQGTTIPIVAKWLGVDAPFSKAKQYPIEYMPTGKSKNDMVEIQIPASSPIVGKQLLELGFPPGALVVLINRGDEFLIPKGKTTVESGDTFLLLADEDEVDLVSEIVQASPIPV